MSIVARRYATALMNLAARDRQVEAVAAGLNELADLLVESEPLRAFLSEPKVALATKEAVVADLLNKVQVPPLVNTFVRFLTHKRRIVLLDEIRAEFHDLADERMGRANADVVVATGLTDAQQDALRSRLQSLTGKEVRLRVQVDPDILGGVVARIGSTVWDSSLRNQLDRIEQTIAKA
jgi:F-type H+-transporting ATPase subunit delta